MDKNTNKVKLFIRAKTPEEMVANQIANSRLHNTQFTYEVMKDGDGWIAWYQADAEKVFKRLGELDAS